MGIFDGILICTDLDGTLLKDDKTISSENREAIEYFKREGGSFTFITGRMPYYAESAYRAVNPNVPFGCVNGGGVYDGATKEYVWMCEIGEKVLSMVECVDRQLPHVGIQVCTFEKTFFVKENETMMTFRRETGLPNYVCDYHDIRDPLAKIIFGSDDEREVERIEELLRAHPMAEDFTLIRSERRLFEILPKGMHKGLALSKLIEHLGIDPQKTVAVGDYNNDVGMLRSARYGIAVANACREAMEAADLVTVSNEEHAIARIIYDIENGTIVF